MPPNHELSKEEAPYGVAFLGRDEATWGDEIGVVAIDPNICPSPNQCPEYNDRDISNQKNDKIHLTIASFRDRLCPRTLYNVFTRATNPHRMYVRVLQQIEPDSDKVDDADCWEMLCTTYNTSNHKQNEDGEDHQPHEEFDCMTYKNNVEIISVDSRTAKGPTDARSKLSALITHDYIHANDGKHRLQPVSLTDYCMQTDSHMDFSDNFDNLMIDMFHRAKNDRAVLSTYVDPIEHNNKDPKQVPHLCMIKFTTTWRNWGTKFLRHALAPKITNVVWGAGQSFSKCHAELNVPYDPFLDNVFDGEETSRGIRFFTHGYDVYTPDKVIITHDYHGHQSNPVVHSWGTRQNAKVLEQAKKEHRNLLDGVDLSFVEHIQQIHDDVQPRGTDRVNIVMGIDLDKFSKNLDQETINSIQFSRYGLGTVRTLEQAYEFAGFDPIQKKMVGHNRCGNIKWVPYETPDCANNGDYCVSETLQRQMWNEEYVLPKDLESFLMKQMPGTGRSSGDGNTKIIIDQQQQQRIGGPKHGQLGGGGNGTNLDNGNPFLRAGIVCFIMFLLFQHFGWFRETKTEKTLQ